MHMPQSLEPIEFWLTDEDGIKHLWKKWEVTDDITIYHGDDLFYASVYQSYLPGTFLTYAAALTAATAAHIKA